MTAEEKLAGDVRAHLLSKGVISEVKMFGGLGFMLNGNLVAAVSKRGLLLRVGKDRQNHALARGKRAHAFLSNAFVEIADRDAERACDLEEPPSRNAVYAALVLVRLPISDAAEFGKLLKRQTQHDTTFMDTGADMIIDRRR